MVVGPLHGLPVSLKDQFHVKGNATSMGYIGWLDTFEGNPDPMLVHNVDSQIVPELISLGAILYCKVCARPQTESQKQKFDISAVDEFATDITCKTDPKLKLIK